MSSEPTTDNITLAVCDLVRFLTGMPMGSVRPSDQVVPAGAQTLEFGTVRIMYMEDEGWAAIGEEVDPTDPDPSHPTKFVETLMVPQSFVASVQFFRGPQRDAVGMAKWSTAAFDRARRLPLLMQLSANVELMAAMGLGFEGASQARNLAKTVDATWESRGSVDITLSVIAREVVPIATILSAQITTEIQDQGGHVHSTTTTVEVPT